ncbi:MAG: class II fumarate hydratase, partial [Gemmatimonadota bacterium]
MSEEHRVERDSMGEVKVPKDALYQAQTQRAVDNFPISGRRFDRRFIRALAWIKRAAAEVNASLGTVDSTVADAVARAAEEVAAGEWDDEFPLDIYQTGSGTSTNMNMNEVVASRATQLLADRPVPAGGSAEGDDGDAGRDGGNARSVHPNDHVNFGQSSNDTIPTAMHVSARVAVEDELIPALEALEESLVAKAEEFDDVLKSGRTHLMDATPVRLGQEFGGYAQQVRRGVERLRRASDELAEVALGGTATGTGINTHEDFPGKAVARISDLAGHDFREAENHFEAQGAKDAAVSASGALNTVATSLLKIADDIRWLSSGPTSGIHEISIPAVQPGSSIMPGKVNPVMAEAVMMVAARVAGNHATITIAGGRGNLELNVMMPVIADALLESIVLLANSVRVFT